MSLNNVLLITFFFGDLTFHFVPLRVLDEQTSKFGGETIYQYPPAKIDHLNRKRLLCKTNDNEMKPSMYKYN